MVLTDEQVKRVAEIQQRLASLNKEVNEVQSSIRDKLDVLAKERMDLMSELESM